MNNKEPTFEYLSLVKVKKKKNWMNQEMVSDDQQSFGILIKKHIHKFTCKHHENVEGLVR